MTQLVGVYFFTFVDVQDVTRMHNSNRELSITSRHGAGYGKLIDKDHLIHHSVCDLRHVVTSAGCSW